jgi:hypothetical protein
MRKRPAFSGAGRPHALLRDMANSEIALGTRKAAEEWVEDERLTTTGSRILMSRALHNVSKAGTDDDVERNRLQEGQGGENAQTRVSRCRPAMGKRECPVIGVCGRERHEDHPMSQPLTLPVKATCVRVEPHGVPRMDAPHPVGRRFPPWGPDGACCPPREEPAVFFRKRPVPRERRGPAYRSRRRTVCSSRKASPPLPPEKEAEGTGARTRRTRAPVTNRNEE